MRKAYHSREYIPPKYPETWITMRKNRLRLYRGEEVYLNHGDEFEIEFDNITRSTWLAQIKINGESVSDAGIVLRPGEHVYLDTPDLNSRTKHKFRFETYQVKKGRNHLTVDNGLVEISWHKKLQHNPIWLNSPPYTIHHWWDNRHDFIGPFNAPRKIDRTDSPDWVFNPTITCGTSLNDNSAVHSAEVRLDSGYYAEDQVDSGRKSVKKMEETGRIEQGSVSNQNFVQTGDEFEYSPSHEVSFKILPASKKTTRVNEIKQYCSDCGRKIRKNENFCPKCGKKH